MADGADETMEVFGEAFMRLVRERLQLKTAVSTNTSGDRSWVSINLMLTDRPLGYPSDEKIICSEVVTLELAASARPVLRGRNQY